MLIIADAHVDENLGNTAAFFQMLDRIAQTRHDVVFLGDTFDLWIGIRRYETALHRKFLGWCEAEKARRTLGFVEGNHEYFIADERFRYFSWSAPAAWKSEDGKILFCHGDMINSEDINYLRFRQVMKNRWTKALVQPLPMGPALTRVVKRRLKTTNLKFRQSIPASEISKFAEGYFLDGVRTIFSGHFHQSLRYSGKNNPAQTFYVVPPWYRRGEVGVYHFPSQSFQCRRWEKIPIEKGRQ